MNSKDMINQLEFEKQISTMSDRALMEFTARQTYSTCEIQRTHEKRLSALESVNKKQLSIGTGVGAVITGVVYVLLELFRPK